MLCKKNMSKWEMKNKIHWRRIILSLLVPISIITYSSVHWVSILFKYLLGGYVAVLFCNKFYNENNYLEIAYILHILLFWPLYLILGGGLLIGKYKLKP